MFKYLRTHMVRCITVAGVAGFIVSVTPVFSAGLTLKMATLVPRGTIWATEMSRMVKKIEKDTGGAVQIKVYYGGSKGTEANMIGLMKSGALDGASFTTVGLGQILPSISVLNLPMFYENDSQVDRVRAGLTPFFEGEYRKQGFELLGWGEIGWVFFFSKKKVDSIDDFQGMKIWAPQGDQLVRSVLAEINVVPVSAPIPAVYKRLQTGELDGVVNSTSGLVGLQWHNHVNYVALQKLTNAAGGTLLTTAAWNKIPAAHRTKIKSIMVASNKTLVQRVRYDNKRHVKTIMKAGIKGVKIDGASLATLRQKSLLVQNKLAGKLYPASILAKARALRK